MNPPFSDKRLDQGPPSGETTISLGTSAFLGQKEHHFSLFRTHHQCAVPKSRKRSPYKGGMRGPFSHLTVHKKHPKEPFPLGVFHARARTETSRPAALPCHKQGDRRQGGNQGNQRSRQNKQDAHNHVEGDGLVQEKERQKRGQRRLEEKDQ